MNYFHQKKQLNTKKFRDAFGLKDKESIFMQESLTKYTSESLAEAKIAAAVLNYKYCGYTINGQVRVKIADGAKFIAIKSKLELDKIK